MKKFKSIALIALVVIGMLFMVACTTTYTVSFDPNGGTPASYDSQSVAAGGLAKEPTPAPTKAGYKFTGWYAPSATTAWDFAKDKVTANITLKAGWDKIVESTHKAFVSWNAYEGATASDRYLVWLAAYDEETGWFSYDELMQVVAGDQTSYSFDLKDSIWKGQKFGAMVSLISGGKLVAAAQTNEKDVVLFDGTKDISIPKLTLVPTNE